MDLFSSYKIIIDYRKDFLEVVATYLAIKEVLEKFLDLRNPSGATNQDNVIDRALVHLGVPHGLLHRLQGALEQVRAELLKPCSGDARVEINSLKQRINFNVGLGRG